MDLASQSSGWWEPVPYMYSLDWEEHVTVSSCSHFYNHQLCHKIYGGRTGAVRAGHELAVISSPAAEASVLSHAGDLV